QDCGRAQGPADRRGPSFSDNAPRARTARRKLGGSIWASDQERPRSERAASNLVNKFHGKRRFHRPVKPLVNQFHRRIVRGVENRLRVATFATCAIWPFD